MRRGELFDGAALTAGREATTGLAEAVAAKKALRKAARAARATAAAERPSTADALASFAGDLPRATMVGLYRPIRDEIDPLPLALALGAPLALPVTDGLSMHFVGWAPGDPLAKSAFGVPEPTGAPVVPTLFLVPLLAFNREGHRLGYGAGHYDRYLASHPSLPRYGVAFAAQERDDLVVEAHDLPLDGIVTENGVIRGR